MNEIHLVTGIAYSTIHTALRRRVTVAIAEVLAQYTRGAVPLKEIRLPRRARRRAA
jgi:hypothetical protein